MSSIYDRNEAVFWMGQLINCLWSPKETKFSLEQILGGIRRSHAAVTAVEALRGKICTVCRKPVDDGDFEIGGAIYNQFRFCHHHRHEFTKLVNEAMDDRFRRRHSAVIERLSSEDSDCAQGEVVKVKGEVVYYILTGQEAPSGEKILKIGTSKNAEARFRSHRNNWPFMEVLATETGGTAVETYRHREFLHLRCPHTRELFFYDSDLRRFVESLSVSV